MTINYAKYLKSNTATASDAQRGITRNLETIVHTSNRHFEQKKRVTGPFLSSPAGEPGYLPRDCGDYIETIDTTDACNKRSRRGCGVCRRVNSNESVESNQYGR